MKSKTGLCLTLLILALPTASAAQEFSAGARSLGIGGSFQALADDATAVFFNPAGGATLGKQFHGSIGTYSRFDDDGDRDNEPTPGPAFVGATYELSSQSAIIGGYYSPFVNERRYDLRLGIPANLSFRETRVEQFFNRLSLGYARSFSRVDIGADAERGALTTLALGATIDLSVTDVAGDLFDSDGQRDRLRARKVAPGFSLGILATLYDSEKFELRLGGARRSRGPLSQPE